MAGNYQKVKNIILRLNQEKCLKNKIIIVGGTVPYLISNKDSNREHSDIDIIVKREDMYFVREYLEREGFYMTDSLRFSYNKECFDYGVDVTIEGIGVNFAPYELSGYTMIQRNFLTKEVSGIDALVTVTMEGINLKNIFAETLISGVLIHTYSLEMIKVMKEKSKKKKDKIDIDVIEDFGYDENIYSLLKEQLKDMKFDIKPKNKLMKLLFR